MKEFLKKIFGSNKSNESIVGTEKMIKEKDPKDYKKCNLSTEWEADDHHCKNCKCSTGHNEWMSDICNSCGSFDTQVRYDRSYRKIFYGGKWMYQVRYRDGKEEIIKNWYK